MSSRHENGERSRLLSNSGSFHSSYDAVEDISEKRNALDITSSIQSQFDVKNKRKKAIAMSQSDFRASVRRLQLANDSAT